MIMMPEDMKVFLKEHSRSNHYAKLREPVFMALEDVEMCYNHVLNELERLAYVAECASWLIQIDSAFMPGVEIKKSAYLELTESCEKAKNDLLEALDFSNSFKH